MFGIMPTMDSSTNSSAMPMTTAPAVLRTIQPMPCTNRLTSAIPSGTAHMARCVAGLVGQLAETGAVRSASVSAAAKATAHTTAASTAPSSAFAAATCQRLGVMRKLVAGMPKRYSVVTTMDCCTIMTIMLVSATVAMTVTGMYGMVPRRAVHANSAP